MQLTCRLVNSFFRVVPGEPWYTRDGLRCSIAVFASFYQLPHQLDPCRPSMILPAVLQSSQTQVVLQTATSSSDVNGKEQSASKLVSRSPGSSCKIIELEFTPEETILKLSCNITLVPEISLLHGIEWTWRSVPHMQDACHCGFIRIGGARGAPPSQDRCASSPSITRADYHGGPLVSPVNKPVFAGTHPAT